ncbi:MAG: integration host factor subunit beta [Bacteroidales bacterium]|nr:integration host factor subunit beta [Bacteroidales bacterium]
MTKAEIVARINEKTGIEKAYVLTMVECIMDTIKERLANGENVYLRHFGTFGVITRREKIGRNISKGTSVVIPEHKIPRFKPSKDLMKMIKMKEEPRA